tara:strand:- start:6649 stop:7455 length:807 start_codon:yes stop_codon:yes gene_type:complete
MNGYELNRKWFNFSFENKEAKPIHTAIYIYAIEHCNKLGWKKEFGFPTDLVMEVLSIKSYNTYSKALKDLVDFGFIKMIEKSKNQWTANLIALSNFDKADNKALDKATAKHTSKQLQSTYQGTIQSIDSINKLLNKETIKLINKQTKEFCDFVNKNSDLIFLKENNFDDLISLDDDFLKMICDYFSQTKEHLKRSVWSFLNQLKNENKLIDFKNQTIAYIEFKKISEEKKHNWQNFKYEFESNKLDDFVDKLSKIQKRENKTNAVVIN